MTIVLDKPPELVKRLGRQRRLGIERAAPRDDPVKEETAVTIIVPAVFISG